MSDSAKFKAERPFKRRAPRGTKAEHRQQSTAARKIDRIAHFYLSDTSRALPWRNYRHLRPTQRHGNVLPNYRKTCKKWWRLARRMGQIRYGTPRACGVCFRPLHVQGYLQLLSPKAHHASTRKVPLCQDCFEMFKGLLEQAIIEPPWRDDQPPGPDWWVKKHRPEETRHGSR